MKQKLKDLLDSKIFWATAGSIVGTVFGEKAAALVNYAGSAVMLIL